MPFNPEELEKTTLLALYRDRSYLMDLGSMRELTPTESSRLRDAVAYTDRRIKFLKSLGSLTLTWNGRRIKVSFDFPPIPNRSFDWSAWLDGDEEFGPHGRGPTRADAVADLLQHLLDGA